MKAISGGVIYYKGELIENKILIFDEKIKGIVDPDKFNKGLVDEHISLDGEYLIPGFIDIHIHGYGGSDVMDAKGEALETIAQGILENGVTSFLPTTMTMEKRKIEEALDNISYMMEKETKGARILGAHMEGPFISKLKKGAQSEKDISGVDESLILKYRDIIKIITLAPELEGSLELIEKYGQDFVFSLGHSSADYQTSKEALERGAKSVTHLFNAMTPLNHRNPGLVGAALRGDSYVEIICDDFHIDKSLYQIVLDTKGEDKVLLISDSIRAGGLSEGDYELGGQEIKVRDGKSRMKDGTIAGSVLKYNQALKNFYRATDITLEDLFKLSSKNQADLLGIGHSLGSIEEGKLADLVVLSKDLDVLYTIVGGKILYRAKE